MDVGQCVANKEVKTLLYKRQTQIALCYTVLCACMQDLELDNVTQTELLGCATKCVPTQYALKGYANRTGPFRSEVVSACALSAAHCGSCERISQNTTLFPGSPYAQTIDRGACDGECDGMQYKTVNLYTNPAPTHSETGGSCVPVTHKFLSFEDPNGN